MSNRCRPAEPPHLILECVHFLIVRIKQGEVGLIGWDQECASEGIGA